MSATGNLTEVGAISPMGTVVPKCHDWQPVPRWSGRYKCSVCGALGYRGMVTATPLEKGEEQAAWQAKTPQRQATIFAYVCKSKGCKAHAVGFGKYQFCLAHKTIAPHPSRPPREDRREISEGSGVTLPQCPPSITTLVCLPKHGGLP